MKIGIAIFATVVLLVLAGVLRDIDRSDLRDRIYAMEADINALREAEYTHDGEIRTW